MTPIDFSKARAAISRFADERRGQVAVFFALAILPVTIAVGASIDYSRIDGGQTQLQQALDAAVLRMAVADNLDTAAGARSVTAGVANSSLNVVSTSFTSSVDAKGRNVYVGSVTARQPLAVMGVLGMRNSQITATSKAASPASQILTATFKPTRVQGAYSKDIFIWTKNAAGAITTKSNVMTYRYSSSSGSSTVTPSINNWTSTFSIPPYSTFGVGMTIYQDWQNYSGALINPKTVYSDDADAATWMRASGVCTDRNGLTVTMEDGGDHNYLDLDYVMSCTVGKPPGVSATLTN
jgi:Flp pilus assembly protein TadG